MRPLLPAPSLPKQAVFATLRVKLALRQDMTPGGLSQPNMSKDNMLSKERDSLTLPENSR